MRGRARGRHTWRRGSGAADERRARASQVTRLETHGEGEAREEAKAKAEEATKEVTAGAAHAASGVSGAAGAVTEEAARLAGDAADSVKGAVETAGDAAKSISRSITSAVGGAIHKARRPAHPRGAPIFSQLGFPSPRPARRVRARFLGRDERRHVRSKSYSYATAPRFQLRARAHRRSHSTPCAGCRGARRQPGRRSGREGYHRRRGQNRLAREEMRPRRVRRIVNRLAASPASPLGAPLAARFRIRF